MSEHRRWDTDERGHGAGDATDLLPDARALLDAMAEPDWVAEDPEAHLLPHLQRWCNRPDSPFTLDRWEASADGRLTAWLTWRGEPGDLAGLRAAAYALIGTIAEGATYVRQRREGEGVAFEVVTGLLPGDTEWRSHGHVVVLILYSD